MLAGMDRGTALFPAYSLSGVAQGIRAAFVEVVSLLFGSAPFATGAAIDREVEALVEPHLAILVHKRAKFGDERWAQEVDAFVGRTFFWPEPAATETFGKLDRRQIAQMVDRIVAEAREREPAAAPLPATSRFGASWAD
jgi:hypothetical protein